MKKTKQPIMIPRVKPRDEDATRWGNGLGGSIPHWADAGHVGFDWSPCAPFELPGGFLEFRGMGRGRSAAYAIFTVGKPGDMWAAIRPTPRSRTRGSGRLHAGGRLPPTRADRGRHTAPGSRDLRERHRSVAVEAADEAWRGEGRVVAVAPYDDAGEPLTCDDTDLRMFWAEGPTNGLRGAS